MEFKAVLGQFKEYRGVLGKGLGTPLLVLAALGMVVLPIPPLMLDVLFSFNIALSIVVLLVSVYTRRPSNLLPSRPYCCSLPCCGWR